ncbi:MAG: NUDIX hydrolase [Caldisericia bacterium]|nr:NUDIX hydrolase [Caldisericia bacterium]
MDERYTNKVTCIVTNGTNLLLIKHPFAGYQLPAGTVEADEEPLAAAIRETKEETSLKDVSLIKCLGVMEVGLPGGMACLLETSTIYSRPDKTSFDWATIPRSSWVKVLRQSGGWTQINYSEPDCLPNPNFETYSLTGWVEREKLAKCQKRHFYHFGSKHVGTNPWCVFSDYHMFEVGWHRLDSLPQLMPPQDQWLAFALERMEK